MNYVRHGSFFGALPAMVFAALLPTRRHAAPDTSVAIPFSPRQMPPGSGLHHGPLYLVLDEAVAIRIAFPTSPTAKP